MANINGNVVTSVAIGALSVAAFALVFGYGFKAGGHIFDKTTANALRARYGKRYNARTVFVTPSRY
ncbi:MAG: hypothetical protein R3321_02540 [Nitrososphaeraceae archaeon]|nr:hypothetical protein [Nitrososphaeraceae archaeon]